mgnify:CR=1 FL=1
MRSRLRSNNCVARSRLAFLFTGKRRSADRRAQRIATRYRVRQGRNVSRLRTRSRLRRLRTPSAYLEDGDWAVLTRKGAEIRDESGRSVERTIVKSTASAQLVDKGNHKHFMAKEIHEQPEVVGHTLAHYIDMVNERVALPGTLPFDWTKLKRLSISACGTAFYAGLVAKYWFERFAKLPVEIDIASEFRYRGAPLEAGDLAIFISQSGETADTLATLRYARENKQHILSVVNVPTSTIARESDVVMPTLAGPEIGVASTKAFTCQLSTLACLRDCRRPCAWSYVGSGRAEPGARADRGAAV